FTKESVVVGKYVIFSYRQDSVKISPTLINLHVKNRVHERLKKEEASAIGQKQRAEIKEEVINELIEEVVPSISVTQLLIDTSKSEMYLAGSSDKTVEGVMILFEKTFKLRLMEANFMATAQRILEKDIFEKVLDKPGIQLKDSEFNPEYEDTPEGKLGAAFLTWLLFYLEVGEAVWASKSLGEFGILIDEYLLLEGEAAGSRQTLLKKGTTCRCIEMNAALHAGKLVSKARCHIARDRGKEEADEWFFVIDKLNYDLQSLKVPKSREGDAYTRQLTRLDYIIEIFELIDEIYTYFLDLRYGRKWKKSEQEMIDWVKGLLLE
ncbi:MAG: recombination-associated protein RdgC, partial [Desulfamplus sp.]|nr:recombination-associated protein RdgC [Desulfamplus sp.]